MKRAGLTLALGLFLCSVAQGESTLALTTLVTEDSPSFKLLGEFATIAFRPTGYGFTLRQSPGERALLNANLGVTDGDFGRIPGLESKYPNLIMVPEPTGTEIVMAYAAGDPGLSGIEDIARRQLRVISLIGVKWMQENIEPRLPAGRIEYVPTLDQAFGMVAARRADLCIVPESMGRELLATGRHPLIRPVSPVGRMDIFLYLNKKWAFLVPALVEGIRAAKTRTYR